jgi:hypothetical protein
MRDVDAGTVCAGLRPLRRAALSALGAGLLYGAWAYLANGEFGRAIATRAAAVQAAWSVALTLVLALAIERRARGSRVVEDLPLRRVALPPLLLVWAGPLAVHLVNGTPAVLRTIAPGAVIGTVFVCAYVAGLARLERAP